MKVLLLIHDDPGQEARIAAALALVLATGGELHCVDVTVRPVMPSACFDPYGQALLMQEEDSREAANKAALTARLDHENVAWRWTDAVGSPADCLAAFAQAAEVIVVNRRLDSYCAEDMRAVAIDLVMRSGRAVLAVPEHGPELDLRGCALVAWNGSPESNHALLLALPLLRLARDVVLFQVGPCRSQVSGGRVKAFLERNGIPARLVREDGADPSAETALFRAIQTQHAAYVVMGGFGHRPLVEHLLGGVTRAMLTKSPVPVLLAH